MHKYWRTPKLGSAGTLLSYGRHGRPNDTRPSSTYIILRNVGVCALKGVVIDKELPKLGSFGDSAPAFWDLDVADL